MGFNVLKIFRLIHLLKIMPGKKRFDNEKMYKAILAVLKTRGGARQSALKESLRPYFSGNEIKTGVYIMEKKGWIEFPDDRDYSYMRLTGSGVEAFDMYFSGLSDRKKAS